MAQDSTSILSKFNALCFGCFVVLAFMVFSVEPVLAHHMPPGMEDVDEFEDGAAFMAGIRHCMLGVDHWLFALAVGAMAATALVKASSYCLVRVCLVSAMVGAIFGLQGVVLPGLIYCSLLASAIPFGLIVLKNRLSVNVELWLIGLATLVQGNAHGIAWPLDVGASAYLMGVLLAGTSLALSGFGIVRLVRAARSLCPINAPSL